MRVLLFVLLIITSTLSTVKAQNEWIDYIVGRPNMFYIEAKKAVAQNWGIAYSTEMAGCIDCEHTRLRAQELDKQNQAYFELLELQYGQHWLAQFNKAVAKKHNYLWAQEHPAEGTWYEVLMDHGDSEFFTAKKEVAAEWGIPYKVIFYSHTDVLDPLEKQQLLEEFEKSENYTKQLQNRLGGEWSKWIEQESKLRLLQKIAPQKGTWTDVVWGMPNSPYYEAKAAVAKRWGINYQTRFMGNERTPALLNKQRDLMRQNAVYFSTLNTHFTPSWVVAFHREVQQAYARAVK